MQEQGVTIHPTAIVAEGARLAPGVVVGPYCVLGPEVRIGARTVLHHNTAVHGRTTIGEDNKIGPNAVIGMGAQHLRDTGEGASIEIGDRNTLREFVTVHLGTVVGGRVTRIGNDNFLMAYVHIGHDAQVGSFVTMANACNLGGHTVVRDRANLGGMVAVHQFVRIGEFVMVGGCSPIRQDVPPYCLAEGNPPRLRGLNSIGLKRNGFDADTVRTIKKAYRILFRSALTVGKATARLEAELGSCPAVQNLISFVRASKRGVTR